MRKNKSIKKINTKSIASIVLAATLVVSSLTGCAGNPQRSNGTSQVSQNVSTSNNGSLDNGISNNAMNNGKADNSEQDSSVNSCIVTSLSNAGSGIDLIKSIKSNFVSSTLNENYNQPLYNLPKDYVFEFECSEEAGYRAYEAFRVYDNSDYESISGLIYNKNTYENGRLTVAPDSVLYIDKNGTRNINDGTWGSLNQLYLVQYIDLQTGEMLDKPLVTPFNIQHDLAAPSINQGVDNNNSYMLSWNSVPGAVEYRVYEYMGGTSLYTLECTTTDTSVSVEEFATQKRSENYTDLLMQDLANAGYSSAVTETDGIIFMNRGVKYNESLNDGYFVVVAVDANGNQSGISNIVDVRDIAHKLPYAIKEDVVEVDITSVMEIPAYVEVEMVDGSVQQMVIDYHGAQAYKFPDENKMTIQAHVANTLFNKFMITLHGMPYDDIMADISYVTEREDELLSRISNTPEPQIHISNTSSDDTNKAIDDVKKAENEVVVSDEDVAEIIEKPSESVKLMTEVAEMVQTNIKLLGSDKVSEVMYASNDLEAWMAMCLIAQSEVIPIPVEVFPDAANLDYASSLLVEAYRQNPTSGFLNGVKYSNEYQAIVVEYLEEPETRLNKTLKEIEAAYDIANEVTDDSMSDYEKVLAINEYFRTNASYDFDSTATEIEDYSTLSEQFIDSHTPYGIICKNYGVCESYSEAFVLTARFAGLEAMCEVGALYGGGHEWNRVKVDGKWRILDVTNNDIDTVINGLLNVTDEQVSGILVPNNSAILDYQDYEAVDESKEYYYMNNMAVTDLSQAAGILAEQLLIEDVATVRIPVGTSDEQVKNVLRQLAREEGAKFSKYGVVYGVLCVIK